MAWAWVPPTRYNLARLLLPPSSRSSLPWPASLLAAATAAARSPTPVHAPHHGVHQSHFLAFKSSSSYNNNNAKPTPKKRSNGETSFKNNNAKRNNAVRRPATSGRLAYYHRHDEEPVKTNLQKRGPQKKKYPLVCSGCGVEIILRDDNQSDPSHPPPHNTAPSSIRAVSKPRRNQKTRYADVTDTRPASSPLCPRCQHLQQNDVWNAHDVLQDTDASVFVDQLSRIVHRRRFGLCVLVVDATDAEFSAMRKLRNAIGASTPCLLVVNKVDLLPRAEGRDVAFLGRQVRAVKSVPRMRETYGVSAARGWGMVALAEGILRHVAGRDVFVVGCANVGKSTLVKNLSSLLARTLRLKGQADFRRRRDVLTNLNVTSSHLPGTTLQAIRIPCFPSSYHALWDTPGIIQKGSLVYSLFSSHWMEPLAFPTKIAVPSLEDGTRVRVRAGESILIEAGWIVSDGSINMEESSVRKEDGSFTLARLDVTEDGGMPLDAFAFVPSSLKIRVVPTVNAPREASMPQEYIAQVERRLGDRGRLDGTNLSKPLVIYKGDGSGVSRDGHVSFSVQDHAQRNGWINQDIVFASLGFIMLCHRRSFTVLPWVVQDSRFLKRPSLYPSNLENPIHTDDNVRTNIDDYDASITENDLRFNDIQQRLRTAYEKGRKFADGSAKTMEKNTMEDYPEYDFDEDWWSHSQ